MLKRAFSSLVGFSALLTLTVTALADVQMPNIFGDNMVLQRGQTVPVWGKADPGEKITVVLTSMDAPSAKGKKPERRAGKAAAGKDGRWMVKLGKIPAGGPWEMTVTGKNTLRFANVLAGEVWVCSGQSNMNFQMAGLPNTKDEVSAANFPDIRYFSVSLISSETPLFDFPGATPKWVECSPATAGKFSAVAYYFGKEIRREIGVPVGLIHSSWGGSIAEAWTTMKTLQSDPKLRPIMENLDRLKAEHPKAKADFQRRSAEREKALKEGRPVLYLLPPRAPGEKDWPSGLYNAMINPMIPYGIRGAIWYQGESNSVRAEQYRALFPAMIRDWRDAWGQGNFPFIYVQLANWKTDTIPVEGTWGSWPELREAQLMTLKVKNTAMAVAVDVGDSTNIHPADKQSVGRRLALGALNAAYGRKVEWSGPLYKSLRRDGDRIRLRFDHAAGGLVAKGGALTGFTLAGEDRAFYPASAYIEGNEVVVRSERVSAPVAVRYGWTDNPYCDLYNSEHLPASPFRTDSWPGVTDGIYKPAQ